MGRTMEIEGIESVMNESILAHAKQGYFGRSGNRTIPVGPRGYSNCYGRHVSKCFHLAPDCHKGSLDVIGEG